MERATFCKKKQQKSKNCKVEFAILQAEIKITGYIRSIYKVG